MYRILIADDEALIRQGIQCLLDYPSLGFSFCGEAANGEEALEKILQLQPDVVLIDIRMPGMSGLEVIRNARAAGFRGKTMIISGYSDFAYAQKAIHYGVQGYLTKPIDEDELEKMLRQFRAELDRQGHLDTTAHQLRQIARTTTLQRILAGEGIPSGADLRELQLEASCYQVVLWEAYTSSSSLLARLSLAEHPESYNAIEYQGDKLLLLKGSAPIRQLEALIRRNASEGSALDGLLLACSDSVETLEDTAKSYHQAKRLMDRRFFCPQGVHVMDSSFPIPPTVTPLDKELMQRCTDRLMNCLHAFHRRMLMESLQKLQTLLTESGNTPSAVKLFLTDLYLQIKEKTLQQYPNCSIPFYTNAVIIHTMEQTDFLHESILFLAGRFEMIMNAIGTFDRDSVLDDILHYIHHNYAGNITLESIALMFGYNRSYLGQIFTKKTGQSFTSYLDYVRVEKAKELLLSSDAKVYRIAEQVGYNNVDYFHIKFRKIVKMSPAQYRRTHAGQE